jgi:hypothetical protein
MTNSTSTSPRTNTATFAPEFVDHRGAKQLFGLSRSHLYKLADDGCIKTVSLRKPGTTKGRRLFVVDSIRRFLTAHIDG